MPNKSRSSSESSTAETVEGCEDVEFASIRDIRELLQSQERMFKSFVEFVAASLTKRVDDLVTTIADLKTEFFWQHSMICWYKEQYHLQNV